MGSPGSSVGYNLGGQELCMDKPQGEPSCQGQSKPGCWGSEIRNPGHITLFGDTCLWDVQSACHQNIDTPTPRSSHGYRKLGKLQGLSTGLRSQLGLIQVLETLMLSLNIKPLSFFQGRRPLATTSFSEGYPSNCPQNS